MVKIVVKSLLDEQQSLKKPMFKPLFKGSSNRRGRVPKCRALPVATKALSAFARLTCHSPSCCHSLFLAFLPPAALGNVPNCAITRFIHFWTDFSICGILCSPCLIITHFQRKLKRKIAVFKAFFEGLGFFGECHQKQSHMPQRRAEKCVSE